MMKNDIAVTSPYNVLRKNVILDENRLSSRYQTGPKTSGVIFERLPRIRR